MTFGQEAARAIYEGDDFSEAARHAALVTVLGLGFEGGLTAGMRIQSISADFGLLKTLPLAYQHKLGLVDDAGYSLIQTLENPTLLSNIAQGLRKPIGKNPIRMDLMPNSAQHARGRRINRQALRDAGVAKDAKEARKAATDALDQLNRILVRPLTNVLGRCEPKHGAG